jgi:hypothetical protein
MKATKYLLVGAIAAGMTCAASSRSEAQISIGVNIGAAPVCPYGYYDYAPYHCAPYGYYGSEWFTNGVFIGAGPWFHGGHEFYGHVDNHFDPHYGYHGSYPAHGTPPPREFHGAPPSSFHGNEWHNGRGGHQSEEEHGHPNNGHPR